jgi:hypothetical protein
VSDLLSLLYGLLSVYIYLPINSDIMEPKHFTHLLAHMQKI